MTKKNSQGLDHLSGRPKLWSGMQNKSRKATNNSSWSHPIKRTVANPEYSISLSVNTINKAAKTNFLDQKLFKYTLKFGKPLLSF